MKAVWTSCFSFACVLVFLFTAAEPFHGRSTPFAPRFNSPPRHFYAFLTGRTVKLKCDVAGVPAPNVSWTRNGAQIISNRRTRIHKTNHQLRIKKLVLNDAGIYTCKAINALGNISATMTLRVKQDFTRVTTPAPVLPKKIPPRFLDYERMKRNFLAWPSSHTFRLKCKATGTPPLTYRWLKNGRPLLYRRLDKHLNTSLWYLKLKDLIPDDNGKYTCIVKNPYGSITHTYTLKVIAKARFKPILEVHHPKNTTAMIGQDASMKCIVVASETLPDFRWLKWKKIPKGYPDDITIQNGSYEIVDPTYYVAIDAGPNYGVELVIVNVTEDDFGLYTCHVGNHIGFDHRSAFLLKRIWPTVTVPTRFLDFERMQAKFLAWPSGHSFSLKCKATGTPPLTYRWLKNGRPLLYRRLDPHLNTSLWYLKLKHLIPDDEGNYTCIVKNPYGSITHTYTLKVIDARSIETASQVQPRGQDVNLLVTALAILAAIIAASVIGLASLFCYSKWLRRKAKRKLEIANLQRLTETKNCKNNEYYVIN